MFGCGAGLLQMPTHFFCHGFLPRARCWGKRSANLRGADRQEERLGGVHPGHAEQCSWPDSVLGPMGAGCCLGKKPYGRAGFRADRLHSTELLKTFGAQHLNGKSLALWPIHGSGTKSPAEFEPGLRSESFHSWEL